MLKAGGTRKVSVTLPDDLIELVRVHVRSGEFSSFCAAALRNHLAHHRQQVTLARSFGIWKDGDHADLSSSEDASSYVRNLRSADATRQSRLRDK